MIFNGLWNIRQYCISAVRRNHGNHRIFTGLESCIIIMNSFPDAYGPKKAEIGEYMNTAIVTDSNSGIFEAEEKELGVSVLPMPVIIEGETHYEGRDLSYDTFYQYLSQHRQVSNSQPSIDSVQEMWDTLLRSMRSFMSPCPAD